MWSILIWDIMQLKTTQLLNHSSTGKTNPAKGRRIDNNLCSCKNYQMNEYHSYAQEQSSCEVLQKLIEIFTSKGWLNNNLIINYQNNRYRISCNEERFFAYRINENCGLSPGVPGWPVCIIKKDYIYDESGILDFTPAALNIYDWLNIMATQNFEVV